MKQESEAAAATATAAATGRDVKLIASRSFLFQLSVPAESPVFWGFYLKVLSQKRLL